MSKHIHRLYFEETDKKRSASKLTHSARGAPVYAVSDAFHREAKENSDDNSGAEAADAAVRAAENTAGNLETAYRSHRDNRERRFLPEEKEAGKGTASENQGSGWRASSGKYSSNPNSKRYQKTANKRAAASKTGKAAKNTAKASENAAKASKKTAEESEKTARFIVRHRKGILIVLGIALVVLFFVAGISSCSVFVSGISSNVAVTTYPAEDADMLNAEARYCEMEAELQSRLDNYSETHNYDEYHFTLDEIKHDPYVLISAVTALMGGEWKADETESILTMLFERQYILTEEIIIEQTKPSPSPSSAPSPKPTPTLLPNAAAAPTETPAPEVKTICYVTLENFNLSHVPVHVMSRGQLSLYAMYMGCLGNRPDLFPASPYIARYYETEYPKYEIPSEALADERFAAMITEAEKYLGYPYIWGGYAPDTSFDCSGFVSFVCNNCGVGWNFGRLSAQGLLDICTEIPASSVRPGDLVFFQGTYETAGASHVGIYVGSNTMLHCGDPIRYENFNTDYWRSHLLAYGHLPNP